MPNKSGPPTRFAALLVAAGISISAQAQTSSITLAWDPGTNSGIAYRLHMGPASRNYTNVIHVGNVTSNKVSGLVSGATYFFAVTAYATNRPDLESEFSNEITWSDGEPEPAPPPPPAPAPDLTLAADSGTISGPFVASNGTLYQSVGTTLANAGRAVYTFNLANAGNYLVSAMVRAPSEGQNSLYLNIDAEPTDPLMIWDIPTCATLSSRTVSWRGNGNGNPASSQYSPKVFTLSAGTHQLIIRGREVDTRLGTITIVAAPPRLQIRTAPGGVIALSGTGQPGQTYNVLCSEDVKAWTVLGTVTADTSGSFQFSDPAASSRPIRMYRLQSVTPPKLQIRIAPGGVIALSGTAQPGQRYNVLCSEDLKAWTVLGTVTADASGSFQFTDPAASSRPIRMYRLQSVTPPKLQIRVKAGEPVNLSGTGPSGQSYNVLRSQDLKTWTPIGAVTVNATGSFAFTDDASSSRPKGFYRLQEQ